MTLLTVENLSITVKEYQEGLRETEKTIIQQLNLNIHEGEIVAIIGASGSGKSILAHGILGILPRHFTVIGKLYYCNKLITKTEWSGLRGKHIALVPQSVNALDPLMKIGKQVKSVIPGNDQQQIMEQAFEQVGLAKKVQNYYPFELSGGMARRVLLTIAVLSGAKLLIADEATPGLDPLILRETIKVLKDLQNEGKGILFITHDIRSAIELADRIVVFYNGQMVEERPTTDFVGKGEHIEHPYTKALWNALPQNEFATFHEKD